MCRYILMFIGVLLLIGVGCGKYKGVCESEPVISNDRELLSGDILLGRCNGFLPAAFAQLGDPCSDYGHAAVFFHDRSGCGRILHMQPAGLSVYTPEQFWGKYYRIGLVRLKNSEVLDSEVFDRECLKLIAYNEEHQVYSCFWDETSDFRADSEYKYPQSLYCLTLINMLYAESGAPKPFEKKFDLSKYPLIKAFGTYLDTENYNNPVVASVFHNINFELVADYTLSDNESVTMCVDNSLVKAVNCFFGEGYRVRALPLVKKPYVGMVYGAKILITPFLPAGIKAMAEKIDSYDEMAAIYMINKFVKDVRSEVLNELAENDELDIQVLTLQKAEAARDKFFVLSSDREL